MVEWQVCHGDVRATLRARVAGSVQCCVTSPPYWGLRDYGTAQWEGGDAACDHRKKNPTTDQRKSTLGPNRDGLSLDNAAYQHGKTFKDACGKCGAKRIDRQIGQEPTPDAYVQTMVEVFREVRRVLHDSGTVWLNVGDSYNAYNGNRGASTSISANTEEALPDLPKGNGLTCPSLKPKDLCLIPWRLAIALQADGWWVRSVICWAKKSCMPESVTDRPTNSWEPIFLLAKSAKYFYDAEAVKELSLSDEQPRLRPNGLSVVEEGKAQGSQPNCGVTGTRNQRNVWHLGPEPYAEAHFATFPTEIPRRAILAGTSEYGCCPKCFAPWVRIAETSKSGARKDCPKDRESHQARNGGGFDSSGLHSQYIEKETRTVGWEPGCECNVGEPIPCTVLDPFCGSGTTGEVAMQLGRHFVGCELQPDYIALARARIGAAMPLFSRESK